MIGNETPLTDEQIQPIEVEVEGEPVIMWAVSPEFARMLERENARLHEELELALAAVRDAQLFINIEQHRAIITLAQHERKKR